MYYVKCLIITQCSLARTWRMSAMVSCISASRIFLFIYAQYVLCEVTRTFQ